MTKDIVEILKQNGWNSFPNVATEEEIANLEKTARSAKSPDFEEYSNKCNRVNKRIVYAKDKMI